MAVLEEPLKNKEQTISRIFQLTKQFCFDLNEMFIDIGAGQNIAASDLNLSEYFDFVKNIPYRRDSEPVEVVARPAIIFERYLSGIGKDCKKAAVLMGSYFVLKNIPWRLVVVSTRPDKQPHHIFNQARLNGNPWINLDATYSNMQPGQSKRVTHAEIFNEPSFINPLR